MTETIVDMTPIQKLKRDVSKASVTLSIPEIRYLVDNYYGIQEYRKAAANQERALGESKEPHEVISWLAAQMGGLEAQIKGVLDKWTDSHLLSKWAKSQIGVGPVIAAGLAAHIDITRAPTVGHIWRFAGLDPTVQWLGDKKSQLLWEAAMEAEEGDVLAAFLWVCNATSRKPLVVLKATEHEFPEISRQTIDTVFQDKFRVCTVGDGEYFSAENSITALCAKYDIKPKAFYKVLLGDLTIKKTLVSKFFAKRPWNAALKTLTWKIGESMVKFSNHDDDFYGGVWNNRKELEVSRNNSGALADQAADKLKKFNIGKSTDAYKAYSEGKLPPAHIHARAKRYAVKLLLSHYQEAAYFIHYGKMPPKPYVIAILGHADYIAPPNMHIIDGWAEAHDAAPVAIPRKPKQPT